MHLYQKQVTDSTIKYTEETNPFSFWLLIDLISNVHLLGSNIKLYYIDFLKHSLNLGSPMVHFRETHSGKRYHESSSFSTGTD